MSKTLGISAYYHDSAAAILNDGNIIVAAQEERFSRKKHDARFLVNAVKYCLVEAECVLNEVETVVFYDKPLVKFDAFWKQILLMRQRDFAHSWLPCLYG